VTLSATIDAAGNANIIWIITQADLDKTPNDYEQFYFTAGGFTSGYLKIIDLTQVTWENTNGNPMGEGTSIPNKTVSTTGTTKVLLVSRDPRIAEGTNVTFEVWEKDNWPNADDYIKTVYATYTGGKVIGTWNVDTEQVDDLTGDYDRFYFKMIAGSIQKTSNNLKLIKYTGEDCEENEVTVCEQYTTQESCEFDDCTIVHFGDITNCGQNTSLVPGTTDCYYSIRCSCAWNLSENSCGPVSEEVIDEGCGGSGFPSSLGVCNIAQSGGGDTCEDGFLNYQWTATWDWKLNVYDAQEQVPEGPRPPVQTPDGKWHYDSILRDSCTSGEKVIPCPTSITLSFFGMSGLIATLVIIAIVYYFIFLFRKKVKKKKKSRAKNKRKR